MMTPQRQSDWDDKKTQKSIDGIRRQIRALGKRAGAEDAWVLGEVATLQDELNTLQFAVIHSLRDRGYTWSEIGGALGISALTARQRYRRSGLTFA